MLKLARKLATLVGRLVDAVDHEAVKARVEAIDRQRQLF